MCRNFVDWDGDKATCRKCGKENTMDKESIMKQWDSWRNYIAEGGEGSWPRDEFENLLDYLTKPTQIDDAKSDPGGCKLMKCTHLIGGRCHYDEECKYR